MNEDKQCLQRDNTEGRCLEEGCGKNKFDVCMFLCRMVSTYDEYIAMVKAGNECQPTAFMSLHGNIAIVVCCAEVLFQSNFSLVSLNTLPTEHEISHALVVVWPHENGARRVPRNLTRHRPRLSAYS